MPEQLHEINLLLKDSNEALALFGVNDISLKKIEEKQDVSIVTRGELVLVSGDDQDVARVEEVLLTLLTVIRKNVPISERDIVYAVDLAILGKINQFETLFEEEITKDVKGKSVRVKTLGQKGYVAGIKAHDLVFGIGPAGTGTTYLAVVMAVEAIKSGRVQRIILTRQAVEEDESLGFLPGDLKEKVDPYLRPLYDALHDVLGVEQTIKLIEREIIEIAPLDYMRGRTLEEAFVILDEAQNTTPEQMKMFLTRLGFGSKMIITGDDTQIDLPRGIKSGLDIAIHRLQKLDEISFVYFDSTDVVRHPLVQKIIHAYEADELKKE